MSKNIYTKDPKHVYKATCDNCKYIINYGFNVNPDYIIYLCDKRGVEMKSPLPSACCKLYKGSGAKTSMFKV